MTEPLSRRAFFGQATAGSAAAAVTIAAPPPPRAWILVWIDWQYNDEYSYAEGTSVSTELYYDRAAADVACRNRCDQFFQLDYPTPADFQPDWDAYDLTRDPDFDEAQVTWAELRRAGFPDPYFVLELTVPGEPHE